LSSSAYVGSKLLPVTSAQPVLDADLFRNGQRQLHSVFIGKNSKMPKITKLGKVVRGVGYAGSAANALQFTLANKNMLQFMGNSEAFKSRFAQKMDGMFNWNRK
jgi:hypothetical protein